MSVSVETLAALAARTGYVFRDESLLHEALTHPSYLQDDPTVTSSNQRLEFLGDSVLHLILTEALYRLYPEEREGRLSRRRAVLTRGDFLCRLARRLGLDSAMRLSASEEQTGGRQRDAALEDALEAYVGAMYMDSDLDTARKVILAWYGPLSNHLDTLEDEENPKGKLQEIVQPSHGNDALRYVVIGTYGAAHEREFEVELFLNGKSLGSGRGRSKKTAEEAAARLALANGSLRLS